MFIHINREEVIQLTPDHNEVSTMIECISHQTWRHQMMLKRQGHKQIAISLAANNNPISVGYMKNNILCLKKESAFSSKKGNISLIMS